MNRDILPTNSSFEDVLTWLREAKDDDIARFIKESLGDSRVITYHGVPIHREYPEDVLEFIFKHSSRVVQNKLKKTLSLLITEWSYKDQSSDLNLLRNYLILFKIFKINDFSAFKHLLHLAESRKLKGKYSYDKRDMHAELLRILFFHTYSVVDKYDKTRNRILRLAEENIKQIPYVFISLRQLWDAYHFPKVNNQRIKYVLEAVKTLTTKVTSKETEEEYKKRFSSSMSYLFLISNFKDKDIALFVRLTFMELNNIKDPIKRNEYSKRNEYFAFLKDVWLSMNVLELKGEDSLNTLGYERQPFLYILLKHEQKVYHVLFAEIRDGNFIRVMGGKEFIKLLEKNYHCNEEDALDLILRVLREKDIENDPELRPYLEMYKKHFEKYKKHEYSMRVEEISNTIRKEILNTNRLEIGKQNV